MIRSMLYDMMFGLPIDIATPNLYKVFLESVEENSKILEIGIGTGLTLERNADIIKRKNIQIHGVDINDAYLKTCKLKIEKTGLEGNVSIELSDILDVGLHAGSYDYVLFMESYPVIPKESLELIVRKIRKACKKESGKIVFIHNLVEEDEWNILRAIIKANLKKITSVEFGRLIVRSDFERWCINLGLRLDLVQVIGELRVSFFKSSIRQYMYFWKPGVQN